MKLTPSRHQIASDSAASGIPAGRMNSFAALATGRITRGEPLEAAAAAQPHVGDERERGGDERRRDRASAEPPAPGDPSTSAHVSATNSAASTPASSTRSTTTVPSTSRYRAVVREPRMPILSSSPPRAGSTLLPV